MRSPYDELPTVQPKEQVKTQPNFLVIGLIALVAFLLFRSEFKIPNFDNVIPDIIVVDPVNPDDDKKQDTKPVDPVSLEGSYIVSVYETTADKMPVWLTILQNDSEFWDKWINDNKMKRFRFPPNNEQSKSFIDAAAKVNIQPPFWVHAKGGKVLSLHQYTEKTTTDEIKRIVTKGK